jgi:hypothetical protein
MKHSLHAPTALVERILLIHIALGLFIAELHRVVH